MDSIDSFVAKPFEDMDAFAAHEIAPQRVDQVKSVLPLVALVDEVNVDVIDLVRADICAKINSDQAHVQSPFATQ
ncbi:hypothetical protein [Qipengyuania vesicularis]|uniref:hypothetical protein n=1 Tax=Qipengyuania vesicularis TaxID=2867232 RepID=UPI001C86A8D4|nr:hypothetical protein [Qipengyuania vesicularis]MBX7526339.1 hypothetical protein [Qipengyuania vesicularis]